MVVYQFEIEDDEWEDWKSTLPKNTTMDAEIRRLIKEDKDD